MTFRGSARLRACAWLAAAVTVIAVAVSGCSSGSNGSTSGRAAADQARDQVVPAARGLYQKFLDARAVPASGMQGYYLNSGCSGTRERYEADAALYPVDHKVSLEAYTQQLAALARAGGWTLVQDDKANPIGNNAGTYYRITKGSLSGHLSAFPNSSPKVEGSMTILSACFDAGSLAASLLHASVQNFPVPASSASASS